MPSRDRLCFIKICIAFAIGTICWSCGVTRHIPEDKYLLKRVVIESDNMAPKEERISSTTLYRYVRQSPNKRLFGTNFYLWAWNAANPEVDNWWNNFKRNMGEPPVYYDQNLTEKSVENLKVYMDSQGFYASNASYEVDSISKRRRVTVKFNTQQGQPYIISDLKYQLRDTMLAPTIYGDTVNSLIHRGDIFSVALLDMERERITKYLRNSGYFNFSVNNIEYLADTLSANQTVSLEMIIKEELAGYDNRGAAIYNPNVRYRVGKINVFPDFDSNIFINDTSYINQIDTLLYKGLNIIHHKDEEPNIRPNVLRQMIPLYRGELYNASTTEQAYQNLMSLGYLKSTRINFVPTSVSDISIDSVLMSSINRRRSNSNRSLLQDSTIMRDSLLTGQIFCTPALRQSYDIELEGSTTSSFYGLYATIGYQNRNIFRGAEAWDVDFTVGYEHMKARDVVKRRATEIGVSTGLTFPRFILPFSDLSFLNVVKPKTSIETSVNWQDRPYYNRTLTSVSYSYTWQDKEYSSFFVRPIDINVINMNYIDETYFEELENEYLKNSYQTQLISGLSLGYVYNNQLNNIGGKSTLLYINAETAGNLLNGAKEAFQAKKSSDGYYEMFGIPYAQYVRGDINLSRKLSVGERSSIAGRIYAGAAVAYGNSTSVPFDRLFYSGGSNSMRGWTPRTLGPGASLEPEDSTYPSQLGDIKLEANIEFRFPIWENFHGATFFDLGNIWYLKDSEGVYDESALFDSSTFYKQLGFNTGIGVRLDIQFAILRFDWGVQLHNPNKVEGERWVIEDFDWSNTAFNFGVGYPF